MISNGGKTGDEMAGPASPDPFDSKSCGGDAVSPASSLSRYSTCGESEFERYCSANSAMGTPRLCGSSFGPINDFNVESEFGSLKSLENFSVDRTGDESLNLEWKLPDSRIDWIKGKNGERRNGVGDGVDWMGGTVNVRNSEKDVGERGSEENDSRSGSGFDEREAPEAESDDGSMYGSVSGDESGKKLYVHRNVECDEKPKMGNRNPLLMNSSVAFGSDDWDDFELETGGGIPVPLTVDKFQELKGFESERKVSFSGSAVAISVPSFGRSEVVKDLIQESASAGTDEGGELEKNFDSCSLLAPVGFQGAEVEPEEGVRDIPVASCQVHIVCELTKFDEINSGKPLEFPSSSKLEQEDDGDASATRKDVLVTGAVNELHPLEGKNSMDRGLSIINCDMEGKDSTVKSDKIIGIIDCKFLENQKTVVLDRKAEPVTDTTSQSFAGPADCSDNLRAEFLEDQKPNSAKIMLETSMSKISPESSSVGYFEDNLTAVKAKDFELSDFYSEMEEILLDSGESRSANFPQGYHVLPPQPCFPSRDDGSTASTSGIDDPYTLSTQPLKIDSVEVVGAKQKKGDVSLSERLVGVKEYTVYILKVWSGKDWWDVERRYRDFFTLYRRMKSLSADQGWTLPSPWSSVEKESRKLFGNVSPDVVSERSTLIQECLSSIIHSGVFSTPPSALVWFLSPQDSVPGSPSSTTWAPLSTVPDGRAGIENIPALGKTISLVVEIRPCKSTKQMIEAQNYTCAGCHRHFDDGMTLMRDFVQKLGWGKPRLCEYTGQLFCSSCHTNDVAVLPARVLHHWDFTQYPVSQLAKSYLDSIHEQPMLCVSAVNPLLFSKVPALLHVMNVRKKVGTMLPYVHCPFRLTINKGLGCRRYLLESNDFFALRDLIDLSKGVFAALPIMLETVSSKILEHITEQCLVCCDVGIPCSARQACSDPSSLIFPFQEAEVERCTSCGSVFHQLCFRKLTNCSCGAQVRKNEIMGFGDKLSRKASTGILGRRSTSALSAGFLAGLFSKSKLENSDDHEDRDTVNLMGSLPSTSP